MSKFTRSTKVLNNSENTDNETDKLTFILNKLEEMCKIVKNQTDTIKKQNVMIEQQSNRIELLEKTVRLKSVENDNTFKNICKFCKNIPETADRDKDGACADNPAISGVKDNIESRGRVIASRSAEWNIRSTKTVSTRDENKKENRKSNQNGTIVRGTKVGFAGNFTAADRMAWLYVGNARNETKTKDIENFLKVKFPTTKFAIEEIIKHEHNKSANKSFKIGFDLKILDEIQKAEIWPNNIIVKRYRFFRRTFDSKV